MGKTEYKLKSSYVDFHHNVMLINSKSFKLTELAPPVRLYREEEMEAKELIGNAAPSASLGPKQDLLPTPSAANGRSFNRSKKRTQIIDAVENEEDIRLREEELHPWILDDSEDKCFVGTLEGGQSSNYVLLVNQGNDFHVVPVNKWYKFKPKIQYKTLSLEEAEKYMSGRGKRDESRWFLKPQQKAIFQSSLAGGGGSIEEFIPGDAASGVDPSIRLRKLKIAAGSARSLDQNYYNKAYDEYDLDYEVDRNMFPDDEGTEMLCEMDVEDEGVSGGDPDSLGKRRRERMIVPGSAIGGIGGGDHGQNGFSNYGKELKKIMKHVNDPNVSLYPSDDEDRNPYATSSEEEEPESAVALNTSVNSQNGGNAVQSRYTANNSSLTPSTTKRLAQSVFGEEHLLSSSPSKRTALTSHPLSAINTGDNGTTTNSQEIAASRGKGQSAFMKSSSLTSSSSNSRASSNSNSPTLSSSPPMIPNVQTSSNGSGGGGGGGGGEITERDIVIFLQSGPQLTAKDLIFHFRRQIKHNIKNKDIIRATLKKVAIIKEILIEGDSESEPQKILELKDEFK